MQVEQNNDLIDLVVAYQKTLSSELGKKVYDDLAEKAGIFHAAVDISPEQLAYNEGRRALYLEIKSMMDADVGELAAAIKEHEALQ